MKLPLLLSLPLLGLLSLHVETCAADDDYSNVTSAAGITSLIYGLTTILNNVTNTSAVDASTGFVANLVTAILNSSTSFPVDLLARKLRADVPVFRDTTYYCSSCSFFCFNNLETQLLGTTNTSSDTSDVIPSQRLSVSSDNSTNSTSTDDSSSTDSTSTETSSSTNSTSTDDSSSTNSTGTDTSSSNTSSDNSTSTNSTGTDTSSSTSSTSSSDNSTSTNSTGTDTSSSTSSTSSSDNSTSTNSTGTDTSSSTSSTSSSDNSTSAT